MHVERWYPEDHALTMTCHEILQAATAADDPLGPMMPLGRLLAKMKHNPDPLEAWVAPGAHPGSALGWYWLTLPDHENVDRGYLQLVVDPDRRRRRIGTELLRHASRQAARHGRKILVGEALPGTAGASFALSAGAVPGVVARRRVLRLDKIPADTFAELAEGARRVAPGYTLTTWTGPTPDGYLDGVAALFTAMEDAPPYDEGSERARWDAPRVRHRVDGVPAAFGTLTYSVAAFHTATGEMAALTQVGLDPDLPEWGQQGLTAVLGPHRGHRLGLQLKAVMAWWLTQTEPRLRHIVTWNAEANRHMIAINTALGYDLFEPSTQIHRLPVRPDALTE